jgi:hypothetical protein
VEALLALGELQLRRPTPAASEATFREAIGVAARVGDDTRQAQAWNGLVRAVALAPGRLDEAIALIPAAEAGVLRAGDRGSLRVELLATEAELLGRRGDLVGARARAEEALALARRLPGERPGLLRRLEALIPR